MSELENLNIEELCVHYKVCRIKPCHAHCSEYLPKGCFVTDRPNREWEHLKEHITELRDANGYATQYGTCQFILNLMGVIEKEGEKVNRSETN